MAIDYFSYAIFVILAINLAITLRQYFQKPQFYYLILGLLTIIGVAIFLFYGIKYVADYVAVVRLFAFIEQANRGKLWIDPPGGSKFGMTLAQTAYYITGNILIGVYLFYIIGSFPQYVSAELWPLSFTVMILAIGYLEYTDKKHKRT